MDFWRLYYDESGDIAMAVLTSDCIQINPCNNPNAPKLMDFFQKRVSTIPKDKFVAHEPGMRGEFCIVVTGGWGSPDNAFVVDKAGVAAELDQALCYAGKKYFIAPITMIEEWDRDVAERLWPLVKMAGDI